MARAPRFFDSAPTPPPRGAHAHVDDRRVEPRVTPSALPPFTARVVEGPEVEVVNVSKTGILTRSGARLLPGASIGLRFVTADSVFVIVGKVVHSRLVSIAGGQPTYESGLAFERHFPLLADPAAAREAAERERVEAEQAVAGSDRMFPREIGRVQGPPTLMTVTAFAEESEEKVLDAFSMFKR